MAPSEIQNKPHRFSGQFNRFFGTPVVRLLFIPLGKGMLLSAACCTVSKAFGNSIRVPSPIVLNDMAAIFLDLGIAQLALQRVQALKRPSFIGAHHPPRTHCIGR